jgi:two-component system NtrC family response regulator
MAMVRKMAPLEVPVLITGNSGAGKEVVAQALHQLSRRAQGPFVPLNCSLLQDNLLESELFGHVKGAFTGATAQKEGLCRVAAGGTLFLDEIGELPASSQAMLLRLLETGEYRPLGGTAIKRTNARIIAATNRNLERMIAEGRFRQDLYYRLNVLLIHVPPLHSRKDDIPLLIEHFLRRGSPHDLTRKLTPAAIERLQAHDWPGNVRELRNVVERMRVLCDDTEIGEDTVQFTLSVAPDKSGLDVADMRDSTPHDSSQSPCSSYQNNHSKPDFGSVKPLAKMELAYVQWVLQQYQGNVSDAARALGVARSTIYRILQRAEESA